MSLMMECFVCGVLSSRKCAACGNIYYCGREHQIMDWKKGHKTECKCYEITSNDELGRHVRATRDIKQGEVILRERPLIYGPKIASTPLCLGCHRRLNFPVDNYYKCRGCGWPLCGRACEQSPHHEKECALMAARKYSAKIDFDPINPYKKESAYCVILPLRCMLMQADRFAKLLLMQHHLAERLKTPLYQILRSNLVTFIQTILGMSVWTEEEILRVAAILDTNSFDIRQISENRRIRGVYLLAAMFSHDCLANARHAFDEQINIIVFAKRAIAKGEIISISYTQPLKSTLMRRDHLAQAKCFVCTCKRCKDPTELNTFIGAILCSKCKVGKVISTDAMDSSAVWRCQLCPHQLTAKQINLGNRAVLKELESLERTAKPFEDFLHRYRDILPENNTHMLIIKYALTQCYGNTPGYVLPDISDADLKRKVDLCHELLEIADIVEGGYSVLRGNLLLDLQEAMFVITKRELINGLITQSAAQEKFLASMNMLKEAIEIMKYDPEMAETLYQRTHLLAKELNVENQEA